MTGREVRFLGPGRPLEMVRVAVPTPGPGEVLVRVTCCTLCRSDLHTHAGRRAVATPMVLGHEILGTIEAVGPGVSWPIGQRVTWGIAVGCGSCFFCDDGLPQKCEALFKYGHTTAPHSGGLADFVLLRAGSTVLAVPEKLPEAVACPVNCATATVAALFRTSGSVAGKAVLVLGAGMLGLTACAMAHAQKAAVVVVLDREPALIERARAFGGTAQGLPSRGADVVFELAGTAEAVRTALASVRIGGTIVLAGTVSPTPGIDLDPERLVRRMLTLRGVHNYRGEDLQTALDFLTGPGQAYPFADLVGERLALDDIEEAFARAHARPGTRIAVIP
ncbi:MAG: zinc-binding dehydrogenase [Gemmataceae bacterium]